MAADDNTTSLRIASFSCYLSNPEDQSFIHKLGGAYEDPYPETAFSVSSERATIKPPSNNSTRDNLANLRVDSFSSYLKAEEDNNFAFKTIGPPVQDATIAFVFPQQASVTVGTPKYQERTKSKDGELNIFGADKYFNMKLDYGAVPTTVVKYGGQMNKGMVDLPYLKPSCRTGTQSICSEASSFNSQSALLQNLQTSKSQTKQKKMTGRRFLSSFGCQGPCLDKKAVSVDETIGHGKVSKLALSSGPSMRDKLSIVKNQDPSIEEQRKSLEVFGSDKMRKGEIAGNLERKLSMLTWDAIPKVQDIPITTIGSGTVGDDMASDASSDLFEIENISSSGYGHMNSQTRGDNYVPTGCISPITTQYAPSEASIEWSVITSSAADYSSVISDYGEKWISIAANTTSRINAANKNTNTKYAVGKEGQKTRPGGLLGCKSNKAVSVVETVYKTGEKAKHHQRG